ncbi:arsenic resistance protein [Catenovulum sp. SM1970]|uniref:arsenic resistance protein n=1 Tax=Marinifaba aquimaris TaxID=2741323 RepID=UPI001571C1CF|nr:arsenic resistance protein [Marinifaba aquimaris]NTS77150.1 arsenic resistance protein [Marinifaba aquimaris]
MSKGDFSKAISLFKNTSVYLLLAILAGSLIGVYSPQVATMAGNKIDPTILLLIFLLLVEVPISGIFKGFTHFKFLTVAWLVNFIAIPLIGFCVASLFLSGNALFYTGLVIYFMAPCTDWYLGFTKLAKGNTELGAAILPINMISQLILFPVYLLLFDTVVAYKVDLSMLIDWFIQPLVAAFIFRLVLKPFMQKVRNVCKTLIPVVLTLLVAQIFAANINVLTQHLSVVPLLLAAIFVFFILTYLLGEMVAKAAKFEYPEHCLLTFTTSARNAPLMLGLSTIALPNQPLIYATITIGMLIEFPHLTALKSVMLRRLKGDITSDELVKN